MKNIPVKLGTGFYLLSSQHSTQRGWILSVNLLYFWKKEISREFGSNLGSVLRSSAGEVE